MLDPFVVSQIFGIAILVVQIAILIVIGAYIVDKDGWIVEMVRRYAYLIIVCAAGASIVGSLTYSELVGFPPCKLCWLQRIFLYPSFVIGIIAWWKNDRNALRYTLALSIIGICISLYHYIMQMTGVSLFSCDTIGQSASCGGVFVREFGYMTIPLMAFTLNAGIIVASWLGLTKRNETQ